MRRAPAVLGAVVIGAGSLLLTGSPALGAPGGTGCPGGLTLRTVASLAATGNAPLPGQIDAAGNKDGLVCVHALPDAACTPYIVQWNLGACLVETLYGFRDNTKPV